MTSSGDSEHPVPRRNRAAEEAAMESDDSAVEDVPGSPTWPIPAAGATAPTPPVGMNWAVVAERLGVDRGVLEHEGAIVLAGEYFPESGFFVDPTTMRARHVDVGDIALRPGYLVGDLTANGFGVELPLETESPVTIGSGSRRPVIRGQSGSIIGLFSDGTAANRAKDRIVRGSLAHGVSLQPGSLGIELRVERPELAGRVATVIASFGGAVISVAGEPVAAGVGQMATDSTASGYAGDARRPGTGVTGDSAGPEITNRGSEIEQG